MSSDSIFDKILRKEIPAQVVYEDDWVLAFRDIAPQAPVHVLVIPKRKLAGFAELPTEETHAVGEYFQRVARVAKELGLENDGYRIVLNHGPHAQQSVPYIHAHIIGGRQLNWTPA